MVSYFIGLIYYYDQLLLYYTSVGNHFFQTLANFGEWTETSTRRNEIELTMFGE